MKSCGPVDHLDAAVVVVTTSSAPASIAASISCVLVDAGREHDLPAMLEQVGDRTVGAEVAAVLRERVADIGDGARAIVRHAVDDHRGAVDAVALIADLFVVHAFEAAGAALDRALDRVLRHVLILRLVHRQAQSRIGRRIAAAESRRDGDFPDQPREDLAALRVRGRLLVLDVRPLAVAGHEKPVSTMCCTDRGFVVSDYTRPCRSRNWLSAVSRTFASLTSSIRCLMESGNGNSSASR